MLRPIACLCVALVLASAPAAVAAPVTLPLAAIGKVNHAGFSRRSQCTGILIAPDRVLTAAHCLVDGIGGKPVPLGDIHFLPGYDRGDYLAHGRAQAVLFAPGYAEARTDVARLSTDAAIIVLTEPLDLALPVRAGADPGIEQDVVYAGYLRSRPEIATVTEPCGVLPLESGLWASNCHAEPGGSGGPVFALSGDGPRLAGIMTAINETGVSFIVPLSLLSSLLAGDP